ncbi:hypothetical protein PSN13_00776 [Micromonospora saelicesensis]|uniref:Uncharacterized protein n=1 Tax=Micromonospora saelicesensis TaxID=285676 RepID=A0A328NZG0_9ACTN|nr:hypothetical protein [Micromonospora saelicesensis]RAO38657.1 hypothetical protein PSN13_00776 [Micromonospora saelicesensis]
MSEHTPQHHNPQHDPIVDTGLLAGVDPTSTDLVAGDPPVPLTVWRTARTPGDAGRSIGTRLAGRLISAYSRPGEAVVDLTTDHALIQACAAGARRHHPAWFTDASSLIIGPATAVPPAGTTGGAELDGEDDLPEMGAWVDDDLTDPELHSPADTVAALPPGGSLQAATSLVVACWPLHESAAANRVRLAWLLTGCAALLQPGGCLILVVTVPAGSTAGPEDFSGVVQAAADVGLGYLQHLVAVTADTDGDAFVYHVTDEELLTLTTAVDQRWQVAHLRVHADLMVFSQAQSQRHAPPRRGGREGGGRRG